LVHYAIQSIRNQQLVVVLIMASIMNCVACEEHVYASHMEAA